MNKLNKLQRILFGISIITSISLLKSETSIASSLESNVEPYYVYDDGFVNGIPSGTMGEKNGSGLSIDANYTERPLSGSNCLKISADGSEVWSGVFIQKGGNWLNNVPKEQLANLTDYRYLVFSARADKDYTINKLGFGDGSSSKEEGNVQLTSEWKRFVFELQNLDMSGINGLFMAVFEGPGTIYLDEIYYAGDDFKIEPTDFVSKERTESLEEGAFYVYSDKWVNGIPTGFMGEKDGKSIKIDDAYSVNPYQGPKCIKISVDKSESWRGLHIQYTGSWNVTIDPATAKLADLSKYDQLVFYARTDSDEMYLLSEAGVGAGGFEGQRSDSFFEIGKEWKKYTIDLRDMDLAKINTLFYMVLPVGTLYLDEIRFTTKAAGKAKKKK
ncbi:MAG TPA: hypothetical protein VIK89_14655 [Cytophagaceae bacterium]